MGLHSCFIFKFYRARSLDMFCIRNILKLERICSMPAGMASISWDRETTAWTMQTSFPWNRWSDYQPRICGSILVRKHKGKPQIEKPIMECFRTKNCDDDYVLPNLGDTTRTATQTASANAFFGHLYYTAAESMPTKSLVWIFVTSQCLIMIASPWH